MFVLNPNLIVKVNKILDKQLGKKFVHFKKVTECKREVFILK